MTHAIFVDKFAKTSGKRAKELATDFLSALDKIVQQAGFNLVTGQFTAPATFEGKVLAFHNKIGPKAEHAFGASIGSAIEAQTYELLKQHRTLGRHWANNRTAGADAAGDYLLEYPERRGALFPHHFAASAVRVKGSRPDIRLALGDGYEALFDITSEAEKGHVLTKGDGHWLKKDKVVFVAEVFYSQDQIGSKVARWNP
jgi:hypothetical protein